MRVVSGTLLVVLTLVGLFIAIPFFIFEAAMIVGSGYAKLFGAFLVVVFIAQVIIKSSELKPRR